MGVMDYTNEKMKPDKVICNKCGCIMDPLQYFGRFCCHECLSSDCSWYDTRTKEKGKKVC